MQVTVVLGERPKGRGGRESQPEQQQPDEQTSKKLGLSIQNLTPDIAQQLGYQNERGVACAAWTKHVLRGDADAVKSIHPDGFHQQLDYMSWCNFMKITEASLASVKILYA